MKTLLITADERAQFAATHGSALVKSLEYYERRARAEEWWGRLWRRLGFNAAADECARMARIWREGVEYFERRISEAQNGAPRERENSEPMR